MFGDDRGYLTLVYSNGSVKRLTGDAGTEQGVAWSRDGKEIWFAASEVGTTSGERMVWAVTPSGKLRKIFQVPEECTVADISADGRLLFTNEKTSGAQMVASPSSGVEHDVSVLGSSYSEIGRANV
jgi:Tol biopolymer transport system component